MSKTSSAQVHISDENADKLVAIMAEFRMMDTYPGYVDWFIGSLRNPDSYFGGTYEFCNRFDGVRIHIARNFTSEKITGAFLSKDSNGGRFTHEEVDAANTRIKALFA